MGNEVSTLAKSVVESSADPVDVLREWVAERGHKQVVDLMRSMLEIQVHLSTTKNSKRDLSSRGGSNSSCTTSSRQDDYHNNMPSQKQISDWNSNFELFWKFTSWSLPQGAPANVVTALIDRSANSNNIDNANAIQTRHIEVILFDLVRQKFSVNNRGRQRALITDEMCRETLEGFNINDPDEKKVKDFHRGVLNGKKYKDFEQGCTGILVVLPHDIGKNLTTPGGRYSLEKAQSLKELYKLEEYAQQTNAAELSTKIFDALREALARRHKRRHDGTTPPKCAKQPRLDGRVNATRPIAPSEEAAFMSSHPRYDEPPENLRGPAKNMTGDDYDARTSALQERHQARIIETWNGNENPHTGVTDSTMTFLSRRTSDTNTHTVPVNGTCPPDGVRQPQNWRVGDHYLPPTNLNEQTDLGRNREEFNAAIIDEVINAPSIDEEFNANLIDEVLNAVLKDVNATLINETMNGHSTHGDFYPASMDEEGNAASTNRYIHLTPIDDDLNPLLTVSSLT